MKRTRRVGAALGLAAAALPLGARAQALQAWPTLYLAGPLGGGVLASAETIGRAARGDERPSQWENRVQLGHRLTRRLTGWVGYVHVATYRPGQPAGIEDQAVEQLDWTAVALPRLRIGTRTRLEQRTLRGDDATAWRAREQVRVALSLRGGPGAPPQAVLWAEPFIALNRTAQVRWTFDQLRVFAGVALPLGRRTSLEVGYLRQRQYRAPRAVVTDAVPLVFSMRF